MHSKKEEQAMDHTLTWIKSVLAVTPETWRRLARELPPELLNLPPAPGQWSAVECLQHLIDTERVFHFRLGCLLAGKDFPAFDPDKQGKAPDRSRSAAELADEFARLRAESFKALAAVGPGDFGRTVRHQELGPVTLREMVHEWAAHDLNHTVQAERALMQPFIAGCGPWQQYFADHRVQPAA
jgi:hypothetical protein